MAVLQEGDRSIRVMTRSLEPLNVGDRAEAIGEPSVDNNFQVLQWGDFRTTGGGAAPVNPVLVNWDQLASGRHAFDLVSIEGKVVTQVREHARDLYIIAADGHLFSANVRFPLQTDAVAAKTPPPMHLIPTGSTVRVTGVEMHDDANPFSGPMAFAILLRSSADVVVMARPSWLNVQNLITIVSGLLILVAGGSAWVLLLRPQGPPTDHRARGAEERPKPSSSVNAATSSKTSTARCRWMRSLRRSRSLPHSACDGAPCWCEMGENIRFGNFPAIHRPDLYPPGIQSRSGPLHGTSVRAPSIRKPLHGPCARKRLRWERGLRPWQSRPAGSTPTWSTARSSTCSPISNRFSFERRVDSPIEESRQARALFRPDLYRPRRL